MRMIWLMHVNLLKRLGIIYENQGIEFTIPSFNTNPKLCKIIFGSVI